MKILNNVTATKVLASESFASGAVARNLNDGQLTVISAKAVVIATGGSARIYERSDNPVDLTGDGFYLAFEAGAELINMEFMAFNPLKITSDVIAMIRSGKSDEQLMTVGRAHYNLGGVMTDTKAESTVKNLFAAGEVADGLLGAARLGGTALANAIVFGAVPGREAGARVPILSRKDITQQSVDEEKERIERLIRGTDVSAADLQKRIKSVMWKYAGMAKTEQSLSDACGMLSQLKNTSMKVSLDDGKEVGQAIEAHLMACVGEQIVVSSLQRKETRGQFWRLDYPEPDNKNCFCNVVLSRHGNGFDIRKIKVVTTRMPTPPQHPLVGCGCYNYLKPLN